MTMTYRSEYREADIETPPVQLVQEFIAKRLVEGRVSTTLYR